MTLSKEELKKFIEQYFSEYQKLIEPLADERKDLFKAYRQFPIKVIAYLSEKGNLWEYFPKAPKFEVEIKEVQNLPQIDKGKHYFCYYLNKFLERNLEHAQELAKREILDIISDYEHYEEYQQELAENYERQYTEYFEDAVKDSVESYSTYIKTACETKAQTLNKYKYDVFEVNSIIDKFRAYFLEELLMANCLASFEVMEEVIQDMESALFLAVHGKYIPANALLRRILENSLTALYFDNKINYSCKVGSRTYQVQSKKRDDWVKSSKGRLNFSGEYGTLADLIDPDTDYIALEALKLTNSAVKSTFRGYVQQTYAHLCRYVHYSGEELIDRFSIDFAKSDPKKFEEWVSRFKQLIEIYAILVAVRFPEVAKKVNKRIGELEPVEQVNLLTNEQNSLLLKDA